MTDPASGYQDQMVITGDLMRMKRNPVAWAALIVSSAALVSSTGFLRPMPAAPKVTAESQRTAKALSEAFGAVAEFVRPSVVQISVQKKGIARQFQMPGRRNGQPGQQGPDLEEMLRRFLNPEGVPEREQFGPSPVRGVGSGFVYDDKGHIVTNNHVVEDAEKIVVKFSDGVEIKAKVVGTDKQADIAVIQVENTSYPPLPKGDSSALKVGELVMAVGSPFGFSQSVTTGIISALERNGIGINDYESFIQTDAAINRGNSGGPLVDMNGNVIGVNAAIVTGGGGSGFGGSGGGNDGIGFTIPINLASSVANMLIKDGKVHYAAIGIMMSPLDRELAHSLGLSDATKGVAVGRVVPDSPAEKAGLQQGDVITGFAGAKVSDLTSFRLKVATSEVAKSYDIVYLRDGKEHTAKIVPGELDKIAQETERPGPKPSEDRGEETKGTIADFGLEVQPLTPELAKPLGLPASTNGLVVTSVKDGSAAQEKGIKEGDVITKVVRDRRPQPVGSVKSFQEIASKSDELAVYVQRPNVGGRFVGLSKTTK
jgi:serine protease Do